jgi:predicted RNase H-like HicB family nuclease
MEKLKAYCTNMRIICIFYERRKIMTLTYPAIFYERKGGYTIEVPDISGCKHHALTLGRAIDTAKKNAASRILTMLEHKKPIPNASHITAIRPAPGGSIFFIILDMDAFAEKYGSKAVRKNITVPSWLNSFAKENHINFSHVLRDALQDIYFRSQ